MILHFQNQDFGDVCNNDKLLKRQHGELRGKKIRRRLDDMKAVDNLSVMKTLPGRCHELKGDRHGQLSLDLDHPWRLIFMPDDDPPALKKDGGIDWDSVRSVIVLGIEDTHE